jgi:hypothetical protein
MKFVYQLEIEGINGLTGDGHLSKRTTTVFPTEKAAKSRITKAKRMAVETGKYGCPIFSPDYPVTVTIRKLEIVYDKSWIKRLWPWSTNG